MEIEDENTDSSLKKRKLAKPPRLTGEDLHNYFVSLEMELPRHTGLVIHPFNTLDYVPNVFDGSGEFMMQAIKNIQFASNKLLNATYLCCVWIHYNISKERIQKPTDHSPVTSKRVKEFFGLHGLEYSDSTIKKMMSLTKTLLWYPRFFRLNISFDKLYSLKGDIEDLLVCSEMFKNYWSSLPNQTTISANVTETSVSGDWVS